MTQISTVAVTGASGFVGRYVVRTLLKRGYRVRALVRDRAKALSVLPSDRNLTLVQGEVLDRRSPAELVAGTQACVNLIGIIRETSGQTFQGMHVEAVKALTEACAAVEQPVKRFVQISALGVRPDGKAEYQRTKFEGEQVVRRSGLDWTIIRPGLIHGPDGELVSMIAKWCKGAAAPFFFVPYFTRVVEHHDGVLLGRVSLEGAAVAPVSVRDVAEAMARAIERPVSIGEIYNLCGSETMGWRNMLEQFGEALPGSDTTLPVIGLPARPHAKMAMVAKKLGLAGLFPFDEGQAYMAEEDSIANLEKIKQDLGLEPEGFSAVLGKYAGVVGAH